jgi:hypothetical protein
VRDGGGLRVEPSREPKVVLHGEDRTAGRLI